MDWAREADDMSNVYTHSALNIAVTSASDVSHGCFLPRDPSYVASCDIPRLRGEGFESSDIALASFTAVNNNFYRYHVIHTPLGRRALVF